jgi:hypothetical protein
MWNDLLIASLECTARGEFDEGVRAAKSAVAECDAVAGSESVEYARCAAALALALSSRGDEATNDPIEALRWSEAGYDRMRRLAGENDPRTLEYAKNLAAAHVQLGQFTDGEKILAEPVARIERGDRSDATALAVLHTWVSILRGLKQADRLEGALTRQLSLGEHLVATCRDATELTGLRYYPARAASGLAKLLAGSGRAGDAASLLYRALALHEQSHEEGLWIMPETVTDLIAIANEIFHDPTALRFAPFRTVAETLLRTPGRRALWETISAEFELLHTAYAVSEASFAAALLVWLRGEPLPPPIAGFGALDHVLRKLRGRMAMPGSELPANFPMAFDLVSKGKMRLADAIDLCAAGDELHAENALPKGQ